MSIVIDLDQVGQLTARLHAAGRHADILDKETLEKSAEWVLTTSPYIRPLFEIVLASIVDDAKVRQHHTLLPAADAPVTLGADS